MAAAYLMYIFTLVGQYRLLRTPVTAAEMATENGLAEGSVAWKHNCQQYANLRRKKMTHQGHHPCHFPPSLYPSYQVGVDT